jgi:Predicted nucleoside-diphosphate sugar epimerase
LPELQSGESDGMTNIRNSYIQAELIQQKISLMQYRVQSGNLLFSLMQVHPDITDSGMSPLPMNRQQQEKIFLQDFVQTGKTAQKKFKIQDVRTVVLRTAVVLSKNSEATEKLIKPFRYFAGGKLGSGNQPFPFIHIRDMVRIIEFILENDSIEGAVNCSSPARITNKEFAKITGKILHRPSIFTVPSFVLKILLDGFADSILKGRFIVPAKLISNGFKFEFADAESTMNDILKK